MACPRVLPALLLLFAALPAARPAEAGPPGRLSIPALPDLTERVRAFREALDELTRDADVSASGPAASMRMESRWRFSDELLRASLDEPPGIPHLRDLAFEEQWLLVGREDAHERAARHWIGRKLKGSDRRARSDGARWRTRLAWDHGALVGVGRGPVSVRFGESQWRLQWAQRWTRSGSPWRARAVVGEEDGEFRAEFLLGRTLLDAYGR